MTESEKKILENNNIVERLLTGDSQGYETLFDNYGAMLLGVISRVVKNDADAENLLQDCFVKIWRNIGSFDKTKGRFATWIINIARNTAIDFTRSKYYAQRRENQSLDTLVSSTSDIKEEAPSTDTLDVRQIVGKLTPPYRQIIEWMYFEGYTQLEISETFNIPLGTVKTRARLAMNELRQHFDLV
jgi:RNA polymerase sigma-70 factor, ECF subfamily